MKLYEPFQFLTTAECDELIEYAQSKIKPGTTLGKSTTRNNRVAWYEESRRWTKWISMFNEIDPVIDWIQTPQIALYSPGEQYGWHTDTWPSNRTHTRYFTLTCELQSAPGARLELKSRILSAERTGNHIQTVRQAQGYFTNRGRADKFYHMGDGTQYREALTYCISSVQYKI